MPDDPNNIDHLVEQLDAQEPGVHVFLLWAAGKTQLVRQVAVLLTEHLEVGDELHTEYNAMQVGWQTDPGTPGGVVRKGRPAHTTLQFEYSVLIVIRKPGHGPQAGAGGGPGVH